MALDTYRDLDAWKVAMDLVEEAYVLSRLLPDEEKFGLTSQLRRAAVSIPSNVAEGYGRSHRGEYLHHLSFARGSVEVETLLLVAVRLKYIAEAQITNAWDLSQRVGQILNRLICSLGG